MGFGTRRALGSLQGDDSADIIELAAINAQPGTARAFSRMVRDVIDWRGQTRLFLQRSHEVDAFPPFAVFWGESDPIIPMAHGRAFADSMPGAVFRSFPGAGHYVHRDCVMEVAAALLEFLDEPNAPPVKPPATAEEAMSLPPAELSARAVPGFNVVQLAWKRLRVLLSSA